ncbi:MAG: DNA translocase FtsK 4TM domain-containing protein, partial [Actinomycetota bacterium]
MATRANAKRGQKGNRSGSKSGKAKGSGTKKTTSDRRLTSAAVDAVADRRTDVAGLALIAIGLVCALGIYADLTGPAGRAIDTATGAVIGVARWLLPPALIALGLALLRQDRLDDAGEPADRKGSAHLVVGSLLLMVAGTGLLHLGRGAPPIDGPVADLESAGGFLGAAIGQPLAALLATGGAVLVLVTVGLVGLVVLTQIPVSEAAGHVATALRPLGAPIRRTFDGLFRVGDEEPAEPELTIGGETQLFDQETDGALDEPEPEPVEAIDLTDPEPDEDDVEISSPRKGSGWKLPAMNLLERTGSQDVDRRVVEETGRRLEAALAEHGVETRLVGMVVGPTVTRFELELGPGVKVSRVTSLN